MHSAFNSHASAFVVCTCSLLLIAPSVAQDWSGETFLTDYTRLQPVKGKEATDFVYVATDLETTGEHYDAVMLDQPEIFIAPTSPYKGSKPADVTAIAQVLRETASKALQQRGYRVVEAAGPKVLYARLAVTDLEIHKKNRGLLAYTPVGFVVDAGVKALQGFMDKYDILNAALQIEIRDSTTQEVLAAAVLRSGRFAGAKKPVLFEQMVATVDELGGRLACRLDNAHVAIELRIDCTDPAARKARPLVLVR